jgi:aspartate/methionine/tyrosine aminotransferase
VPKTAQILEHIQESVINEMNQLALQYGAINLASGYPDFDPPTELLVAAVHALKQGHHQYTDSRGSPLLRQALAEKQSRFSGLEIDGEAHVTITCGSTEAMLAAIASLCDPGDKVLVFSPFYETYVVDAIFAHAQVIFVPLHPPDFHFEPAELRRAFEQGVKALVLCNPSNPCGKVFTLPELQTIAALAEEFDAFVVTDEVYEHIIFPPYKHIHFASLPGMFERTITCGSLSKTYAITGWRLGYTIAPTRLTQGIRKLHNYLTLCAAAPLQEAAITALQFPPSYYQHIQVEYTLRRQIFLKYLDQAGLPYTPPQGAYFVLADITALGFADDYAFCRWIPEKIGVAGVPGSYFFHEAVHNLVRFTFAKREQTLIEAGERLMKIKERNCLN